MRQDPVGGEGPEDAPRWLRRSSVAWLGAVLALAVLLISGGFLWHERQALEQSEVQSAELYSRVLQDHAERTFDTIDIALTALADRLAAPGDHHSPEDLAQELSRTQVGLPFLRSLSILAGDGRVVASSSERNNGVVIDLSRIPLPQGGAPDALGSSIPGRDLADATAEVLRSGARSPRSFVPFVRKAAGTNGGDPMYIVATINPDYFANEHELVLADESRSAAVLGLDGTLLSVTANLVLGPGARVGSHPFFTRFLPARESGSLVGPGIDGDKVVSAFRVLRKRPVVVIFERRFDRVLGAFRLTETWVGGVALSVLALIGAAVVMAWRSLRAHEAVRGALAVSREGVATSERDMRALVESVHELIFRADGDGRITFVNGRWQQLTGHPAAAILGRRFADVCTAADRPACDAVFAHDRAVVDPVRLGLDDASRRRLSLELSASPVVDPRGATIGFAGFAVDITEREASRGALESQLKFTARLLEVSPTPMFVKDAHGRFTMVNRAWLTLMALELPDVLGRDSNELFGASGPAHRDQDARLLESEDKIRYKNRLNVPGREPRDTIVTKVRFTRADGTPAGMVGSIIDVTEYLAAERDIRQARDAAVLANRAKGEFIANISHELRTPLQAIIGFSEIGGEMASDHLDFQELFVDIHAGGKRMLTLVNGLLDVSQLEGAIGSLALERSDISGLVEEAVGQLQPRALERSQTIRLRGLDTPHPADVDPARFLQAIRNVLVNAIRFAPESSVIEVACTGDAAGGLCLTVKDQGPGIPEDELELIFESFVQSSRTRDGSGGTGLGLTITRKIMSAHGGSVVAANGDDGGALLRISLPPSGTAGSLQENAGGLDSMTLQYALEDH